MSTLKLHHHHLNISENPPLKHKPTTPNPINTRLTTTCTLKTTTTKIRCGLRNVGPKKPMWRTSYLSTEGIQAVHALKLANNPTKLQHVFNTRISRLLKVDLLDTLSELQRQNELHLSLKGSVVAPGGLLLGRKVFEYVKEESWYTPNLSLYYDMIMLLGKNKLINKAEDLFTEIQNKGLKPDTRAYTELIGAYFQASMIDKAMETYTQMKTSGCTPDKLTLMIMVRNLEKAGREDLATLAKNDFEEYVDEPEKFLEEVERRYARNPVVVVP